MAAVTNGNQYQNYWGLGSPFFNGHCEFNPVLSSCNFPSVLLY